MQLLSWDIYLFYFALFTALLLYTTVNNRNSSKMTVEPFLSRSFLDRLALKGDTAAFARLSVSGISADLECKV